MGFRVPRLGGACRGHAVLGRLRLNFALFGATAPTPAPEKIPAPPPPPDLTDVAVRQARIAARRRALIGQGSRRRSSPARSATCSAPSTRAPSSLAGY
jgi:hypothetical protein